MGTSNSYRYEPISVDVDEVKYVTDKALLVDIEGEEFWIPRSQIHEDSELYNSDHVGESGVLVIPRWLAEEKGLA